MKNFLLIFLASYVCSALQSNGHESYDNVIVHSSQPLYTSAKLQSYEGPERFVTSYGPKYDPQREYSPELSYIYSKYLNRPQAYGQPQCDPSASSQLSDQDLAEAQSFAGQQIQQYEAANQAYLAVDPRGLNFSAYIFGAILQSRYNEFTTQYLIAK